LKALAATKRSSAQAAPLIEQAIASMEDEDGWVTLGAIGSRLRNAYPDFDQRTYGYTKLSDLIRSLGQFDVQRAEPGGTMRIRRKSSSG
jgi:Fe-S-cluster formation regulator IscX/YfhJ